MSTPPFFLSSFYFCPPFLRPSVPPSFICFFPSLFSIQLKCFLKYIGISQAHMQIHSTLLFSNIDGLNAYLNLFCHWTEQRFPVVTFLPQCLLLFKCPIITAIRAQLTPDLCNSANSTATFQVLGMCGPSHFSWWDTHVSDRQVQVTFTINRSKPLQKQVKSSRVKFTCCGLMD